MKTCFIQQPSGLGDILLTIKIANYFYNLGYNIIWPVLSTYNYLNNYIKSNTCEINFVDINSDFIFKQQYFSLINNNLNDIYEKNNFTFVPLCNSSKSINNKINLFLGEDYRNMIGKFDMCGITSDNWQEYFYILRNHEEENALYSYLNINEKYHLINKEFGTPPFWREILRKNIITPSNLKSVHMSPVDKFNIFSWLKVFEKADKIDTVSTSNFYLFEKINLNCIPTIYSRNHPERSENENFLWMKKLAKNNYIYIS